MTKQEYETKPGYNQECSLVAVKAVLKWYGWGSPIGLSIFFIGVAICIAIIRWVFTI